MLKKFDENPRLAGLALKVVPSGDTLWDGLQDFDYAMGRVWGAKYLKKAKKLRCIAGAGGIWRRTLLSTLLERHSGRHNGDDMELTAMAQGAGYDVEYESSVIVKTNVPKGLGTLITQRRRWELGALETFEKELGFYWSQVKNLRNRLGHITLWEWYNWIAFPIGMYIMFSIAVNGQEIRYLWNYYLWDLAITAIIAAFAKSELKHAAEYLLIPIMPIYRAAVMFPAKTLAACRFAKDRLSVHRFPTLNSMLLAGKTPVFTRNVSTIKNQQSY